jgi:hypothetical protein
VISLSRRRAIVACACAAGAVVAAPQADSRPVEKIGLAEAPAGDRAAAANAAATTAERARAARYKRKVRSRVPAWGKRYLRNLAWCESRNNPRAIGGGGMYRGLYQFSARTWYAVGGRGDPAAAPRHEQTWRAWLLLSRHGSGHWPVCG